MACQQVQLLAVVAAVACLASLASAKVWIVGDADGWRAKFNETGWEKDKTFFVGDNLIFMYPPVNHTVVQVGKEDFAACNVQANNIGAWPNGTGADVVPLVTPGKAWFICTMPNHCLNGMKMVIDVKEAAAAPAEPPSAAPVSYTVGGAVAVAGAVVAAVLAF